MAFHALDAFSREPGTLGTKHRTLSFALFDNGTSRRLFGESPAMDRCCQTTPTRRSHSAAFFLAPGTRHVRGWFSRYVRYDPPPRPDRGTSAPDIKANGGHRS